MRRNATRNTQWKGLERETTIMSMHGYECQKAYEIMPPERRKEIEEATKLICEMSYISGEELAELLGLAQGGSPFDPWFTAELRIMEEVSKFTGPEHDRAAQRVAERFIPAPPPPAVNSSRQDDIPF